MFQFSTVIIKDALNYLRKYNAVQFLNANYEIEHTLREDMGGPRNQPWGFAPPRVQIPSSPPILKKR